MQEISSDRPMSPLVAALWTIGLFVLEQLCVSVTESVRPGAQTDLVNLGACWVLATSAVIFAIVRVHARDASLRVTLGVRPPAPLQLILAVAAGAGLYPVTSMIDSLIAKRWPYDPSDLALDEKLLSVPTMRARVALVVTAFVVIPIARELFFRGILFSGLRRTTPAGVTIASTAVFFASFAGEPRQMPTTLLLGVALAVLRERTGTVLTAIVAHLAFWSVVAIPVMRGRDPTMDVTYPTKWIVGGAVIALLALVGVGAGRRGEE
jgi:membrane protease YdiL (CAAX protease family)